MTPEQPVSVFIASRRTRPPYLRVLWQMSQADAEKVCTDPRTAGENYGLHWTATGTDDPEVARFVPDDGRHQQVLAELVVTVLACYQETQR